MQTIALIVTDDTGEGVLEKPEDPDERYDDMTLIGAPSPLVFWGARTDELNRGSLPALRRFELDGSVPSSHRLEASYLAPLPRRRARGHEEAAAQKRRCHHHLVRSALYLSLPNIAEIACAVKLSRRSTTSATRTTRSRTGRS